MLKKRISKKAAGASPQAPLGELSALPQTPLLSREGALPLPYPPPVVNIFIRPPFPKILDPPLISCLYAFYDNVIVSFKGRLIVMYMYKKVAPEIIIIV